jgi:hypothetical protein
METQFTETPPCTAPSTQFTPEAGECYSPVASQVEVLEDSGVEEVFDSAEGRELERLVVKPFHSYFSEARVRADLLQERLFTQRLFVQLQQSRSHVQELSEEVALLRGTMTETLSTIKQKANKRMRNLKDAINYQNKKQLQNSTDVLHVKTAKISKTNDKDGKTKVLSEPSYLREMSLDAPTLVGDPPTLVGDLVISAPTKTHVRPLKCTKEDAQREKERRKRKVN